MSHQLFVARGQAWFERECWQDYMDAWGSIPRRSPGRRVLPISSRSF